MIVVGCARPFQPAPVDLGAAWTDWLGVGGNGLARVPADTPIVAWEVSVGPGVRSTPVLTAQTVVVSTTNRQVRVFNREDGTEHWSRRVGAPPGPPLVVGNRIYVATEGSDDGEVRSLKFQDGNVAWRRRVGPVGSPIVFSTNQIYGTAGGAVAFALDAVDGRELWRTRVPGRGTAWGPVLFRERVFFVSGADTLYSLDRKTGRPLAHLPLAEHAIAPARVAGDTLVLTLARGILAAFALDSLRALWVTGGFNSFVGNAVIADGEALAATRLGEIVAVRLADGRHRVLAELGQLLGAGPTLVEGGLLIGTLAGHLHFMDLDGRIVWTRTLEGTVTHPPAVAEGRIVVPMYGPTGGFLGSRPHRAKLVLLR